MRTAIITAADHTYYPFLDDLLSSIDKQRPDASIDVCVLDGGLTAEEKASLSPRVARLHTPGWDIDFPARPTTPNYFQTVLARPFLPRHFPEYDRYIFLDADLWLQDWNAIALLLLASERDVMAIVPEIHRSYAHNYRQNQHVLFNVYKHYQQSFGETIAKTMLSLPVINSGVWAMKRDLPFWAEWATLLDRGIQQHAGPLVEQCALNIAIYTGKIGYYPLPPWCNWMCGQSTPLFNPATGLFHEPLLPHDQLSILHLTEIKARDIPIDCLDGTTRQMRLTFSGSRDAEVVQPSRNQ
jgi:hypothetical protein